MKKDNYKLKVVLLPDGKKAIDVWISEGRFHFSPRPDCEELYPGVVFACAGLVDCHSHIAFLHDPEADPEHPDLLRRNRVRCLHDGILLIRDMGSTDKRILDIDSDDGLTRVLGCGGMLLNYDYPPFSGTQPEQLVETAVKFVEHGAPWVKVFGDWADDYGGQADTGFGYADQLVYPLPILREAIDAVHELGSRVAVHCFNEQAAEIAIEAGADSLEHGWFLSKTLIETMAERAIAWVPTLAISHEMKEMAVESGDSGRVQWLSGAMNRLKGLLPYAASRGVPILAGTDWYPGISVVREIQCLHEFGLDRIQAIASATTVARRFLGFSNIEENAVADMVIYRHDPREDLEILAKPDRIFLGGAPVSTISPAHRSPTD